MTSGECSRSLSVHCYFANTTCLWTNDPEGLQWFSSDSYSDHSLNGPANPENRGIDGSILPQYVWIAKGCVLHFSELLLWSLSVMSLSVRMGNHTAQYRKRDGDAIMVRLLTSLKMQYCLLTCLQNTMPYLRLCHIIDQAQWLDSTVPRSRNHPTLHSSASHLDTLWAKVICNAAKIWLQLPMNKSSTWTRLTPEKSWGYFEQQSFFFLSYLGLLWAWGDSVCHPGRCCQ